MVALSRPRFWAVSPQKRLPLAPDPSRGAAVTRQDCRPPTCSRTHKVSAVPRLGSGVNVIDLCGEVAYFRHCRVLTDSVLTGAGLRCEQVRGQEEQGLQRDHQDQVAGLHLQVHHLRHLWRLWIRHMGRHRASLRPEDAPRRYRRLRPLEAASPQARLHSFFGLRSSASQCPHAPRL